MNDDDYDYEAHSTLPDINDLILDLAIACAQFIDDPSEANEVMYRETHARGNACIAIEQIMLDGKIDRAFFARLLPFP